MVILVMVYVIKLIYIYIKNTYIKYNVYICIYIYMSQGHPPTPPVARDKQTCKHGPGHVIYDTANVRTYIHTLHYITIHYIRLHYITLHYITYIHTYIDTYIHTRIHTYIQRYIDT